MYVSHVDDLKGIPASCLEVLPRIAIAMLRRNAAGKARESNCWNTTRKLFEGSKHGYKWDSGTEMHEWLKENTRRITENELQPGDIVSFYGDAWNETGLLHTVYYLGKGLIFHKDGVQPFEITVLEKCGYSPLDARYHRPTIARGQNHAK